MSCIQPQHPCHWGRAAAPVQSGHALYCQGRPALFLLRHRQLQPFQSGKQQHERLCRCQAGSRQNDSNSAPDLKDNSLQHRQPQQRKQQQQQRQQQQRQQQQQAPNAYALALNPSIVKILYKRTLKQLASLPLAIGELFVLAGLSAIGTVIEQNKPVQFYLDSYPDGAHKVLGFLTYRWIFALQFDHIYTAPYFLGLMALLGASLAACTSTRQLPMVKLARRWRFAQTPERVYSQGSAEVLPDADVSDLGHALRQKGYQVFRKGPSLYAFKGLAGRLGPIGVHASMLAIMAGVAIGGLGGFRGSVMVPQGGDFLIAQALRPNSPVASLPEGAKQVLHVNGFNIDYRPDGSVQQFNSDLSVLDLDGQEMQRNGIFVNKPLRYRGVTAYQTDWSIAAVTLRAEGSPLQPEAAQPFNLPMASLEGQAGVQGQAWATYVPAEGPPADGSKPRGATVFARDFQTVVIYDSKGQFVGVRRPGSGLPIQVEGMQLVVDDLVGSTGLELKVDPGVPYVYAGFAGLMITTLVSYLSHSQIWALQQEGFLHVGGRTNRATLAFAGELSSLLDAVPDRGPGQRSTPQPTQQPDGASVSTRGAVQVPLDQQQQGQQLSQGQSRPVPVSQGVYVSAGAVAVQQQAGEDSIPDSDMVPDDAVGNANGGSIGYASVKE